jgi:large subunit ribosomal protein L22
MKRVRPAPMGRAFRIVKRTTHLTVEVTERPQVIKAVGEPATGTKARGAKAAGTKETKSSKGTKARESATAAGTPASEDKE